MVISTKYDILIGYSIFLMAFFTLQIGIGYTTLTGSMPIVKKPVCSLGVIIIDGLFNCAWQYLQPFFILFDLNSSLGLFNNFILMPYLLFLGYIVINTIRGVA
jgi:hypothetical protein